MKTKKLTIILFLLSFIIFLSFLSGMPGNCDKKYASDRSAFILVLASYTITFVQQISVQEEALDIIFKMGKNSYDIPDSSIHPHTIFCNQ